MNKERRTNHLQRNRKVIDSIFLQRRTEANFRINLERRRILYINLPPTQKITPLPGQLTLWGNEELLKHK